jgi:hypothetical protein
MNRNLVKYPRICSFGLLAGTAVESFAKLADSIYFHDEDPAPDDLAESKSYTSSRSSSKVDPPEQQPPRLYVNQLVSVDVCG